VCLFFVGVRVTVFVHMFVNEFVHTYVMMSDWCCIIVCGEHAEETMLVPTISARSIMSRLASFGDHSFNVIGPRLWNLLLIHIKYNGTL